MDGTNQQLAAALDELAALLTTRKVDRYRVRAYERGARTIRGLPVSISALELADIRRLEGIGPALGAIIDEFLASGSIGRLEQLRVDEPAGMGELLRLPLLGVRDARAIAGDFGIPGEAALRAALEAPEAEERMGQRLASRARESLRRLDNLDAGVPLLLARRASAPLAEQLATVAGVSAVVEVGAVRRGCETVTRLGLLLEADDPPAAAADLAAHSAVLEMLSAQGAVATAVTTGGWMVDIVLASPGSRGTGLVIGTGSPAHLEQLRSHAQRRGTTITRQGLCSGDVTTPVAGEEDVYAAVGLQFIPPELREGTGEIAAAVSGDLPQLVTAPDLLGDLHVHTDWSRDGKATLDEMVTAAIAAGHRYVALTDHAENLTINGMPREKVLARREAIADARTRYPQIAILEAAELNIGLDGTLDYDLDFLLTFDFTVASIHSHMDRPISVQTDRILTAIAHPAVDVIGHPTGRILGHRPAYAIEMSAIAQAAAETGTALEVNGSPRRLDLAATMVRTAVEAGAALALSSDAHSVAELHNLGGAATVARRGWATPAHVVNTLDVNALRQRVAAKRARSQ